VTDKGERKATGSFYTPEYIVKYLVKNTLGPLIDKMMEEAMMSPELRAGLLKKLLSLKVLDPAMGSGHFLVEATDYIAREIIHAREMARQEELESEAVAEADIHWARREVVRNCIYGVDLNPMAVELAKLSLWLTTVAANKPLSFLDHHLRCGNSLIGAELERLTVLPGRPPEDTPLWSFGLKSHTEGLLKKYSLMAALPDDSLAMVKWKEDQFRQIKEGELSKRMAELANVWLSTYFGNKVGEDDYFEMQNHISPDKFPDWSALRSQEWFIRAQELAQAKRFFHWELEFPEAFQGESRGFDVVIGNPPYVRQERLGEDKRYFEMAFETYHGVADLYVYFFEMAHKLLKECGNFGFISSNKFMRSNYGKPLRNYLINSAELKQIIDFGELPVFPEAATFPAIYLTKKKSHSDEFKTLYAKISYLDFKSLETAITNCGIRLSSNSFKRENWTLAEDNNTAIMQKMDLCSKSLEDYTGDGIKRGIVTGFNEAFIIDRFTRERLISEDPKSKEIIKQFIFGDDIRKYEINFKDKYIIFARRGIDILNYPAILRYLEQFRENLQPRKNKDAKVGRKPGNYKPKFPKI